MNQSQISDAEAHDSPERATPMNHQDKHMSGAVSQEIPSTVEDPAVEPTRLPESYVAYVRLFFVPRNRGCAAFFCKYLLSRSQLTLSS